MDPAPYSPFGRDVGGKEKGTDLDIKSAGARERVAYQSHGHFRTKNLSLKTHYLRPKRG